MIRKIIFIAVVIFAQGFAQRQKFRNEFEKPDLAQQFFYTEVHSVLRDSANLISFSYRIPYSRLVFIKDDDRYLASFRLALEITDTASNHVTRQIEEEKFYVNDFDETLNKNNYYQNVVSFNIKDGRYKILPFFTDLHTNVQIKLRDLFLDTNQLINGIFYSPIIVSREKTLCHNDSLFTLTNFDDSFPYSDSTNEILIPCSDTSVKKINVVIRNNSDTVYRADIFDHFQSDIQFKACSGNDVVLGESKDHILNNFIISDLPAFSEGEISIFVKADGGKVSKPFIKKVIWFDKPFSLRSPEAAIKLLKYIEPDSVINNLLRAKSDEYKEALYNYWKKYRPSARDTYNPLMKEYYSRIDFAARNFATISGKSGIETDRAKIYIQFGAPQKIERSSNQYGKVVETWIYSKPKREFVFIDNDGTGNFKLK